MAFNIFKKKEDQEKKNSLKPQKGTAAKKEASDKKEKTKTVSGSETVSQKGSKKARIAYRVIKSPHIAEKATLLGEQNRYVFRVFPTATKGQVKESIEKLYGVDVKRVHVITIPSKKVRVGRRRQGVKPGYKKAIVTVREGQKLDVLPV